MSGPRSSDKSRREVGSEPLRSPVPAARPAPGEDLHLLGAVAGAAVWALGWSYPLWRPAWRAFCPLREIAGIPCPTCFGTRALLAVFHAHWLEALRLNPLVAIGGIAATVYVPVAIVAWARNWPQLEARLLSNDWFARVAIALLLINWLYLLW